MEQKLEQKLIVDVGVFPKNGTEVMEQDKAFLTSKRRRCRFTYYNYTEKDLERLKSYDIEMCRYICWGYELCPTTQKPHLQGYVEFDKTFTGAMMLKRLIGSKTLKGNSCHGLTCESAREANIAYCKKVETGDPNFPEKFFERINAEFKQGERNDVYTSMLASIEAKPKFIDIAREYPENAFKYHSGIKAVIRAVETEQSVCEGLQKFADWKPYIWQANLIEELSRPPKNDRSIIWFNDPIGGHGKSKLADYIELHLDAESLENGRSADMSCAWQRKPIVVIDLVRSLQEHVNYGAIEAIKAGKFMSTKYDSAMKRRWGDTHVVVFANWPPDMSKMTHDKFDIRSIDALDCIYADEPDTSAETEVSESIPIGNVNTERPVIMDSNESIEDVSRPDNIKMIWSDEEDIFLINAIPYKVDKAATEDIWSHTMSLI